MLFGPGVKAIEVRKGRLAMRAGQGKDLISMMYFQPWPRKLREMQKHDTTRPSPRCGSSSRRVRRIATLGALLLAAAFLVPRPVTAAPALPIDLDAFDAQKKTVTLPNGETLAYIDMGKASGPAVVLIHGYTDSARDWVPLLPYLSKDFRLILLDIRGHGKSGKPECCYARLDFAYDLKLLLDELHIERVAIVGHSLGSIIAQTFAEFWPERTTRVVLISSTGGVRPGTAKRPPQFDFAASIRQLKEPIEPDSAFMISWWDSPTPVDPDFIRREREDAAAIPLRVWLAVLDQGLAVSAGGLKGADPIMEPSMRKTLRDGLPQAKVKIFDGLGHNPFWEQPAAVANVLNAFLTG
jgi:pimeloyl-ACP methyl ester carboxylesterase